MKEKGGQGGEGKGREGKGREGENNLTRPLSQIPGYVTDWRQRVRTCRPMFAACLSPQDNVSVTAYFSNRFQRRTKRSEFRALTGRQMERDRTCTGNNSSREGTGNGNCLPTFEMVSPPPIIGNCYTLQLMRSCTQIHLQWMERSAC